MDACWALLFLSFHKEWKQKVIAETNTIHQEHTSNSDPVHKRLASIPVSAWEGETPILDLVLRETLRLTMNVTLLYCNVIRDIDIDGKRIPRGHFLTYSMFDTPEPSHLDQSRSI